MIKTGVVILCHGSRGPKALVEIPQIMKSLVREVGNILPADIKVVWGALQFNNPDLEESVKSLIAEDIRRIIIMPYFLFSGNHITGDIPEEIEKLQKTYPEHEFVMTKPLGTESSFPAFIAERILTAVPDLAREKAPEEMKISPIEIESMEIITRLLPESIQFPDDEMSIVKRIVHATGDPQIAGEIRIHKSAVTAGMEAIKQRKPVYTDVRMVQAGISRSLIDRLSISVHCVLDETSYIPPDNTGKTRSAAGFLSMNNNFDNAIIAIGNAPTALFALLDLIKNGVKPALVIGMPVGFVQAAESKEALMKADIPYISIAGMRGGSPSAAATVNALLRLSLEK